MYPQFFLLSNEEFQGKKTEILTSNKFNYTKNFHRWVFEKVVLKKMEIKEQRFYIIVKLILFSNPCSEWLTLNMHTENEFLYFYSNTYT